MTSSFFKDSTTLLAQAQARLLGSSNISVEPTVPEAMMFAPHSDTGDLELQNGKAYIETAWNNMTTGKIVLGLFAFLMLRAAVIVIYRLTLHPLAKYPGPKLAAMTRLYEFWYQGIKITEFPEVIKEMHKKYGPIVRISPEEISINDSKFNVDYFGHDRNLDKDPWYYSFGFTDSLFTLLNKNKHKERQGHLSAHMSGAYFAWAAPMISREVQDLVSSFENSANDSTSLNVSLVYRKVGNEILRTFLLGKGGATSTSRDYAKNSETAYHPLFRAITYIRHFKWLFYVHKCIPNAVYELGLPMAKFSREAETNIRELVRDYDSAEEKDEAVLYRLLEEDPTYRDNNAEAAVEEFMELLWGGREVMGHALTNITYHLMNKPSTMEKLFAELKSAPFDLTTATQGQLATLPYLRGVCKEGIRMQLGGGFRIPRVNKQPVQYGEYLIPANTPLSMCPNFFHDDPEIFEDPEEFKPERWSAPNADELERFWKPFGTGSRSCAGRNMALEVVFRATANVFSRYSTSLSGIDAEYVRGEGMLKVFPHGASTGLIVSVEKRE